MLVRFNNIDNCLLCTQTVDFNKLRAIGLLNSNNGSLESYFIRLSFDGGGTLVVKTDLAYNDAVAYRNMLEGYWLHSATHSTTVTNVPA